MVGDHSRQMKTQICTIGDVGVLRQWISLITNPQNCWGASSLSQINVSFLENLGKTSGEYTICWQNLGWSAKIKIPDRLRFSRHMKTGLRAVSLVHACYCTVTNGCDIWVQQVSSIVCVWQESQAITVQCHRHIKWRCEWTSEWVASYGSQSGWWGKLCTYMPSFTIVKLLNLLK